MSIYSEIERIVREVDSQTNLISQIQTALEGKAAGGGSGSTSIETCEVTVVQTWGQMNDPSVCTVYVSYYDVQSDGSIVVGFDTLTSANDFAEQHSVSFTSYKNVPFAIFTLGSMTDNNHTATPVGGTLESLTINGLGRNKFYRAIPTADTVTFTIALA